MGLSVGAGYFGVEALLAWWNSVASTKSTKNTKRRRHALYHPLLRHVQEWEKLLSFGRIQHWLLRCWTLPIASYDIMWGVFVAVLPASRVDVARGVLTADNNNNNDNNEQKEENDVFLTLPPQLQAPKATAKTSKKDRYLELLLHNVSHTDLVLGLESIVKTATPNSASLKSMCLGRPRFSAFDMYCRRMLEALEKESTSDALPGDSKAEIILVPQHQRSQIDPRYSIQPSTGRPHVATGFCWKTTTTTNDNPRVIPLTAALADLRVRGKDISKLDPCHPGSDMKSDEDETTVSWNLVSPDGTEDTASTAQTQNTLSREHVLVELKAVFFPLLATLLPRWHEQMAQKYKHHNHNRVHKVLVLVTGVGTPRNWTHSITGNSTQILAELMQRFLAVVYPDITVVKIHSDTNIFRYDDNIMFVQQELLPTVNAYRDAHATHSPYPHELTQQQHKQQQQQFLLTDDEELEKGTIANHRRPNAHERFDVDWKKSFAVTLSFADGSPARTHAIQTALRIYRPTYFHIWQLKTFWHERKIVDDDTEVHSFEEMETSPALESRDIQGDLAAVVKEMKAFREEMTEALLSAQANKNSSDIHSFWLRKTHKPVLAVLLVQTDDGPPVLYRGTNMEVSMPTGSLCAERNVIGTALASNPKLKREDLKCIAVLAVPPPPKLTGPPRPPRSGSGSIGSASDSSHPNPFDGSAPTTMTGRQMRRQSFDEREEDWMLSSEANSINQGATVEFEVGEVQAQDEEGQASTPVRQISLFKTESSNSLVDMIKQFPSASGSSPIGASAPAKDQRRTVLVRSDIHDINPLRPCGACHEWLKKIAECNPHFQIMTFTDAECNGVYCTPCQE
jgi:cytidine deaminase